MTAIEENIRDAFEEFAEKNPDAGVFEKFERAGTESVVVTTDGRRWYARQIGGNGSYLDGWRFYDQWV